MNINGPCRPVPEGHRGPLPVRAAGLALCLLLGLAGCQPGDGAHAAGDEHGDEHGEHGEHGDEHDTAAPVFAFEWMGVYDLPAGRSELVTQPGPDATMTIALVPVATATATEEAVERAGRVSSAEPVPTPPGAALSPGDTFYELQVGGDSEMRFAVDVPAAGTYALFTQHFADEFQTIFDTPSGLVEPESTRSFSERFGQIPVAPEAVETFGVRVETVRDHALRPSFVVPARVSFNTEGMAHVGSAVAGRVTELAVRRGDAVKRGDVLLTVDSPELGEAQSDYLRQRTAVEIAAPAVELATAAHERAKALYDENQGISLTEVQRRQADQQTASGALLSARAAVAATENKLQLLGMDEGAVESLGESGEISARYTVRAPIDGQVIRREVTLGELVGPDRDALLVLADLTTLWVLADVPEARLGDISIGAKAQVTLAALPEESFEGTISFVSPEIDAATRTADARIEVENGGARLRPGMFAQAEITAAAPATTRPVRAVPDGAIQMVDGRTVVFVPMAGKPGTYLKRPVTLGSPVGDLYPVRYGLTAGEPYVSKGSFILKAELGKSSAEHGH